MTSEKTMQIGPSEAMTVLDKMSEGILILETVKSESAKLVDLRFAYLNTAAFALLDIKDQNILSKTFLEIYPRLKNSDFFNKCLGVMKDDISVERQLAAFPNNDNRGRSKKYFEYSITKFNDTLLMVTLRNITKGKENEKTLKLSNKKNKKINRELKAEQNLLVSELNEANAPLELFRLMGETIPYGLWMTDEQGKARYISHTFLDIMINSQQDAVDYGWTNLIPAEDIQNTIKQWEENVRSAEIFEKEQRYLGKDGQYHYILAKGRAVKDNEGHVKRWVGINLSIDERKKIEQSLIEREELFRTTFEQSAIGFKHINSDGKFIRVNKKFCEISGYSREELQELTYDQITYPEDLINERKQLEMLISGTVHETTYDKRYIKKDGSLVWCNLTSSILENPNTERLIISAVKEISDRKAAEEIENAYRVRNNILLEISKKILDRILNYDSLLKYIVEKTSSVLGDCCILSLYQEGYVKVLAMYHPDQKITDALTNVFSTMDEPVGNDLVSSQIIKGKDVYIPHFDMEQKKGAVRAGHFEFLEKYKLCSLIVVPLEAEGKVLGQMSLSRYNSSNPYTPDDLIFLKKIASRVSFALVISKLYEKLKISEERFRLALTDTPITVFNTDRDLNYTWIYDNENIPDPGIFIGKKVEDFLENDEAKRLSERKKLVLETKTPLHFEECLKIKGESRYYDMHIEALLDQSGNAIGLKGVSIDITDRKKIENRLKDALIALKQSNKELEQFAYIASHDLQEPLRMVSNFTQLLNRRLKGKLADVDEQYMTFIVNGTQLMQNLISDLLKFSRITSQKTSFEETDMNEIVASVINNLSITINEKNAKIISERMPVIKADKIQMIQLFQNLISNALKFVHGKVPEVHIGCVKENNAWKFSVTDNGIGINPDHYERIFLIFQRLHTREEYDGTGIGLAMCKKIVDYHKGRIWIESEEGKGSAFYFTIPE